MRPCLRVSLLSFVALFAFTGLFLSAPAAAQPGPLVWAGAGDMITPRTGHTVTLLQNGKVLVTGGSALDYTPHSNYGDGTLSSAELYDPATGLWSPTGSMNVARQNHGAVLLGDGKVFIAGGFQDYGVFTPGSSYTEVYDPASGSFTVTNSYFPNPYQENGLGVFPGCPASQRTGGLDLAVLHVRGRSGGRDVHANLS